jgi:BirA family biotin operon repressor/biotin-[acetyl-CoA-carboxylase] ligase
MFGGKRFDYQQVARQLLTLLDEEYWRLLQGDLATLEACWKWRVGLLGKRVRVECLNEEYQGRLVEQSFDGLEVQTDGGMIKVLPETVRHLEENR